MLVQYEETDWQFLRRVASRLNRYLVADYTLNMPYISIGMPSRGGGGEIDSVEVTMKKDMSEFWDNSKHGVDGFQERDAIYYEVISRDVFDLCDPNLDYNEITELPPSAYRLKNLKYLYLSNLNFDDAPANISQLQSLEYLNLGSQLHNIPDEICELKSLKYLEFGQLGRRSVYDEYASSDEPGLVTSLPENIGGLNNLEVLRINNLPIKTLPSSFSKLKNLKRLIILGVPLEALPEDIEHLTSLEEINLGGAPLKVVPDNLKELPKLRIIHL